MHPSCRELNSDDFPFFRNLSSTSRTRDSFFGSLNKTSSSSSSRLIKRNENSNPHPLSARWWIKRRRQKSQMLPISSQSLNGANSASRRAREVPKKGKSSEFNQKNYEQVKSSPSLTVWSHEGSNLYPKIAQ